MKTLRLLPLIFLTACAGMSRDCSSWSNTNFGADWLVAQFAADGHPLNCWRLPSTAMTNEGHTDGIYWKSPGGHLVHISGWYNRVQVRDGNWDGAAAELRLNIKDCR